VGGKTAAKWINQYGSLERILNADGVDSKVLEKIAPHREQILSNRQMVALDLDLPLPFPIEGMKVSPRYPELVDALRRCEFRSLTAEVEREASRCVGQAGPKSTSNTATTPSPQGELF
jgi:DNA polymerase-1